MDIREAYTVLDIEYGSPLAEIEDARKTLLRVWHPDRFSHAPDLVEKAGRQSARIVEATTFLRDAWSSGHLVEPMFCYVDQDVRYFGSDPRLPPPSIVTQISGRFGHPCAVRISSAGFELALINGNQIVGGHSYDADDIEGIYFGAFEWTNDAKSKNIRTDQFGYRLPDLELNKVWLVCRDPAGIVSRLLIKLEFRNEYHSELFFRTVVKLFGFEGCGSVQSAAPAQPVRTPPKEPPSPTQEAPPRQPTATNPKPTERSEATNSEPTRQVQSPPREPRSTAQHASAEQPVATDNKPQSTEPLESPTAAASSPDQAHPKEPASTDPRASAPPPVLTTAKLQTSARRKVPWTSVNGAVLVAILLCPLPFIWDLPSAYLTNITETRPDETASTVQEIPHLPVDPPPTSSSPPTVEPPALSQRIPVHEADPKHARPPESPKVLTPRSVPSEAQRHSSREYEAHGRAYLKHNVLVSAIAAFTEAIRSDPSNSAAWNNRGHAYVLSQNWMGARSDFESALQINPENASATNNLAWLLVTSGDRTLRDPDKGLSLALRACALTKPETPANFYGTLAAALAATGDFKNAAVAQQRAVDSAGVAEKPAMRYRLELYRQEKVDWD